MSLDVWLTMPGEKVRYVARIFRSDDRKDKEVYESEWQTYFPGTEPLAIEEVERVTVFEYNITHNLTRMAAAAGIYQELWRPEEIGVTQARQLVEPLRDGWRRLLADPDGFKKYNPVNGWGDYDALVRFVRNYLSACEEYPDADVSVSR